MNTPAITIRPALPDDLNIVLPLMEATEAHYYDVPPEGPARAQGWTDLAVGDEGHSVLHLAFLGDELVGYASIAVLSPGCGPAGVLFMKELFVIEAARGYRVGEAMMAYLARIAADRGIERIDWTTTDVNEGARRFYKRIGASEHTEKVYLRLDGEALANLAARGQKAVEP